MKKTLLLSVLVAFSYICQSQSQFGIFAGVQATSAKYTIVNVKQTCDNKYGFNLGIGWKIPFENKLYFSPAIFYSLKGYKVKFDRYSYPPDSFAVDNNTSIHTFELGFLLQFDLSQKPNHFFIKGGPSLDFQLSGREKFHRNNGDLIDQKMPFSFGDYGHYSASALIQFGYETHKGFVIAAQYTHGLTSINNHDGGPQIKHRAYGISFGKYFHK
jgi:hypothetical protein